MVRTPGIFLSHSHRDKPFVRRLADDLSSGGIRVWIDEAEMLVGDSLIEKLREGIDAMDYVGAVISRHSVASEWVRRELDVAMNQEIGGRHVKVLPLLLDDCMLPGFLTGKLFADFRLASNYGEALNQVLRRLRADLGQSKLVASPTTDLSDDAKAPSALIILRNPKMLDVVIDDHNYARSNTGRFELPAGRHELYVVYRYSVHRYDHAGMPGVSTYVGEKTKESARLKFLLDLGSRLYLACGVRTTFWKGSVPWLALDSQSEEADS